MQEWSWVSCAGLAACYSGPLLCCPNSSGQPWRGPAPSPPETLMGGLRPWASMCFLSPQKEGERLLLGGSAYHRRSGSMKCLPVWVRPVEGPQAPRLFFPRLPTGGAFSPGPLPAGFEPGVARFQDLRSQKWPHGGARLPFRSSFCVWEGERQTGVGPRTTTS